MAQKTWIHDQGKLYLRSKHPLYRTWYSMIRRCYDKWDNSYRWYGAKGIQVCNRWRKSFQAFVDDMGPRPSAEHEVERLDANKNYEPINCCWLHKSENRPLITNKSRFANRSNDLKKKGLTFAFSCAMVRNRFNEERKVKFDETGVLDLLALRQEIRNSKRRRKCRYASSRRQAGSACAVSLAIIHRQ